METLVEGIKSVVPEKDEWDYRYESTLKKFWEDVGWQKSYAKIKVDIFSIQFPSTSVKILFCTFFEEIKPVVTGGNQLFNWLKSKLSFLVIWIFRTIRILMHWSQATILYSNPPPYVWSCHLRPWWEKSSVHSLIILNLNIEINQKN